MSTINVLSAATTAFIIGEIPTEIVTNNARRRALVFQNTGAQAVYISFGSKPVNRDGQYSGALKISPLEIFKLETNVPFDTIYAVSPVAGQTLTVMETVAIGGL